MVLVDSSFLVALFKKDDDFHNQAISIFKELTEKKEKIIVPSIILQETLTVLTYKVNLDIAKGVYEILPCFIYLKN